MKHTKIILTLFFLFESARLIAQTPTVIRALNGCPDNYENCFAMDLNWKDGKSIDSILISQEAVRQKDCTYNSRDFNEEYEFEKYGMEPYCPYDDITFYVYGRLNGGELKDYHLVFRSFVDGIDCTDFGQGEIATIGFNNNKEPIVLTNKGELQLEQTTLSVGCNNCVALINKNTLTVSWHVSPTWSLWRGMNFVCNKNGDVYFSLVPDSTEHERKCFKLSSDSYFLRVDESFCDLPPLKRASKDIVEFIRNARVFKDEYTNERLQYDLFAIEGTSYIIFIYGIKCT
tara:strand:+ start:214 stop:1074 length:861 start_codon:yes stop_codon:yes gene_type:complete